MATWVRELLGLGAAEQWIVSGLLGGFGFFVLVALLRAWVYIRRYGFINYLKSAFEIRDETWGLIFLLAAVGTLAVLAFWRK